MLISFLRCVFGKYLLIIHEIPETVSVSSSTAGYRSAKYTPGEWFSNYHTILQQAATDRGDAERIQRHSKTLSQDTEALTAQAQAEGTRLLGDRLQQIHYWKSELQQHIQQLQADTDALVAQKTRLERALDATEIPYAISTDNLTCRTRRPGPDLVRDTVEEELLKVSGTKLKSNVKGWSNRDAKKTLEFDWSDKFEAYSFDDLLCVCVFRMLVERVLQDTTRDLRVQCSSVDQAFSQRCDELIEAKTQLEIRHTEILDQIGAQERNIVALQQAIHNKEAPLRVAQSRLYTRTLRPNMELCRDDPQLSLEAEEKQIHASVASLQQQLSEARASLSYLEESRMTMEKDISCKTHSLFIDRDKCMTQRKRYPNVSTLSGY
uniref:Tektin n=1 Tax=Sphaeramia orbicularis TaxID=375764 RepID=A0A672Z9B3_9TELE